MMKIGFKGRVSQGLRVRVGWKGRREEGVVQHVGPTLSRSLPATSDSTDSEWAGNGGRKRV